MDVLPDIEFRPVRQRKDADAFALVHTAVVKAPQFGSLVLWIPTMIRIAERVDTFLRSRLLFVTTCSAEGRIELVFVERLQQTLGLHDVRVLLAAMRRKRIDSGSHAFLVDMDDHV